MQKVRRALWKQCVGLVTDFTHNYRSNIFFRTRCHVIGLVFLFAVFICAIAWVAMSRLTALFTEELGGRLSSIYGIRESGINAAITRTLETLPLKEVWLLLGIGSIAIILFGLLIAWIALRPTRDALASQKQFIGNIAHELRTPLAIIKTNIEVALLDESIDSELRSTLNTNVDALDRSSDIINNLLSLNTLLNPKELPFSDVDLGGIVEEAMEKLSSFARERGVRLTIHKKEFLIVHGNKTALLQVAINLIKNALIHTPKDGAVAVTLQPDYRGHIEFQVADTGAGIPQKELVHIFEPFYQAERSRAKQYGGSGLGLAIVSEVVKLHGGKIIMQSTEKRGTRVTISLPCGSEQAPEDTETRDDVVTMDFADHKRPVV